MTSATTSEALTDSFTSEWLDRFITAWNSHDPDRLAALTTDDVRWQDPFIHGEGVLHGTDALRAWLRSVWRAMPDLEFRAVGAPFVSLDRNELAAAWTGIGHMTGVLDPPGFAPTNREVEMFGIDVHSFESGLLASVRTVTDVNAVAVQLGAAPPPNSVREKAVVAMQRAVAAGLRHRSSFR